MPLLGYGSICNLVKRTAISPLSPGFYRHGPVPRIMAHHGKRHMALVDQVLSASTEIGSRFQTETSGAKLSVPTYVHIQLLESRGVNSFGVGGANTHVSYVVFSTDRSLRLKISKSFWIPPPPCVRKMRARTVQSPREVPSFWSFQTEARPRFKSGLRIFKNTLGPSQPNITTWRLRFVPSEQQDFYGCRW